MMGQPTALAVGVGMGEGGGLAGGEQPVDGAARGAPAVGVELAEQVEQADPAARLVAEARPGGRAPG